MVEILRTHSLTEQRYAEVVVDRLCHSYSYDNARRMFRQVEQIPGRLWTREMIARAREAAATNGQLIDGFIGQTTVAAAMTALADSLEVSVPV